MFLPDAVDFGQRKVEMCGRYGLTGLYPLDNKVDPAADDVSLSIFKGNVGMMNEAVAVIANLTPFRGPSADAGTANAPAIPRPRSPNFTPRVILMLPLRLLLATRVFAQLVIKNCARSRDAV